MKVIVFGASGATGTIVTEMLLDKGHKVTAYVRNPMKVTLVHENLSVVEGDIFDNKAIERVLKGQEAIISCLGSNTTKASDQLCRMAQSISSAMKRTGLNRLVYMSTAGIENEFKGVIKWIIRLMLGHVIDDHRNAANLYKESGFDYTIIRPMQLKDGEANGHYEIALEGLPRTKKAVSRANVAHLIVKVLDDESYYGKSISIAE